MNRFRFNARKAMAYISERVRLEGEVDVQSLLGTLYLADKDHFVDWGRPVFGGDYQAERIGPVNVQVRAMLMGDPVYLCEADVDSYAWTLEGRRLYPVPNIRFPDPLIELSLSDVASLRAARDVAYESLVRNPLRDRVIHDAAWSKARGGLLRFEDIAADAGLDLTPEESHEFWHRAV